MAHGTNKGGAMKNEAVTIRTTSCLVCNNSVSYRQSKAHSRGGRYCKKHGDNQSVMMVMIFRAKENKRNAA